MIHRPSDRDNFDNAADKCRFFYAGNSHVGYLLKGFRFIVVLGLLALNAAQVSACPGDFDGNGRVNIADFLAFAEAFGARSGDAKYNAVMDMDGSGAIDISDFLAFVGVFGTTCEPSTDDRAVLVAFYEATGGANWNNGTNWLTDAPLGEWHGVEVDGAGRVVDLNLRSNNLTGYIPAELGSLDKLVTLQLSSNNLPGPIPPELGLLVNLKTLNIQFSHLTGPIPRELGSLQNLSVLHLHRNNLTDSIPPEIGNLRNLTYLDLGWNNLTGSIPPELGDLEHLRRLSVYRNSLTGGIPPEIDNLVQLRSLWVSENGGMTGALPLSLSRLALDDFRYGETRLCVPDNASFRTWLNDVARLEVSGFECSLVYRAPLEALYRSVGGEAWTSSHNWLTDAPLSQWYGVQVDDKGEVVSLDLSNNDLTGSIPSDLGSLSALKSLNLMNNTALQGHLPLSLAHLTLEAFDYSGTNVCVQRDASFRQWLNGIAAHTGTGLECEVSDRDVLELLYWATGGPRWKNSDGWLTDATLGEWHGVEVGDEDRVVSLRLFSNNLTGDVPPQLGSLKTLRSLTLISNNLAGAIPPELGNLGDLINLYLNDNNLTGAIPPELGNLGDLINLYLNNNNLTGAIPPAIGNLTVLRRLRLHNNNLTGAIPAELGNLAALQTLSLYGNNLTDGISAELGNLVALRTLDLRENDLTGPIPAELGNLAALRTLDLRENDLTGPISAELGNLAALRTLDLSDNDLTGEIPPSFSQLTQLELLVLQNNGRMSGAIHEGLTGLRQLTRFQLEGTGLCAPITSEFQEWLDGIPTTRVLRCGNVAMPFYLTQAVQSAEFPVPLVAGKDALLRVFVASEGAVTQRFPRVRATFFQDDGSAPIHVADIAAQDHPIPAETDEGDLSASVNARIPGNLVAPGLEMVVEVDPDSTLDPALGITRHIPASGRTVVDVRTMPTFDLTVVPLQQIGDPDRSFVDKVAGLSPDSATFSLMRKLLPIGEFNLTIKEPLMVSNPPIARYCASFLPIIEAARVADGATGNYVGIVTGGGIASLGGRSAVSNLSPETMAHELGHNMSLRHAPCGAAGGLDPYYPYPGGAIGAWGYDSDADNLVSPSMRDIMGYCYSFAWISDYHFNKAMDHRLREANQTVSSTAKIQKSLLLWGGVDAGGIPQLHPAFVVEAPPTLPSQGGPFRLAGRDENGRILFSMNFRMQEIADGDGGSSFVFAIPTALEWEKALASITLSGPGGSATLDESTDRPMAILRDPKTRQVRGFLSDLPAGESARAAAKRAAVADPALEVLFSRGIPDLR